MVKERVCTAEKYMTRGGGRENYLLTYSASFRRGRSTFFTLGSEVGSTIGEPNYVSIKSNPKPFQHNFFLHLWKSSRQLLKFCQDATLCLPCVSSIEPAVSANSNSCSSSTIVCETKQATWLILTGTTGHLMRPQCLCASSEVTVQTSVSRTHGAYVVGKFVHRSIRRHVGGLVGIIL